MGRKLRVSCRVLLVKHLQLEVVDAPLLFQPAQLNSTFVESLKFTRAVRLGPEYPQFWLHIADAAFIRGSIGSPIFPSVILWMTHKSNACCMFTLQKR